MNSALPGPDWACAASRPPQRRMRISLCFMSVDHPRLAPSAGLHQALLFLNGNVTRKGEKEVFTERGERNGNLDNPSRSSVAVQGTRKLRVNFSARAASPARGRVIDSGLRPDSTPE